MPKLPDDQCIAVLGQVAVGRTALEMAPLLHAAHEGITLASESAKHEALVSRRSAAIGNGGKINPNGQVAFDSDCWDDLTAHLSDGEGSNHIDVALGLVWKALLARDQPDLEAKLYLLMKAAHRTFPHVRKTIESELAADSAGKKKT